MIFQAHMGEVELPDAVVLVETDEQFTVSYGEVARHGLILSE